MTRKGMELKKQRCFNIPENGLDLFLTALHVNFQSNFFYPKAAYIFQKENSYDVVVNCYGSYPFLENNMDKFAKDMWNQKPKEETVTIPAHVHEGFIND